MNRHIDQFMASFPYEGLTFDDVSLETGYADFLPETADLSSSLSRGVTLNVPFVSAAMDTVTESEMAIAMALLGGIGVIHKNQGIQEQARDVSRVKHYLHGLIADPIVFHTGMKVSQILAEREANNYNFTGFPILDHDGRLAGIITSRDFKFLTDYNLPVEQAMSKAEDLVVGREGTTTDEAFDIMVRNRVGKLPLVDNDWRLIGLYSFHDVQTLSASVRPGFNRDSQHRLRVAAAIGPGDQERVAALAEEGADALVVDTSHGHSKGVMDILREVRSKYTQTDLICGNVATAEAAVFLARGGADAVKVGIGPGSICTTRVVAGVGVPQLSAVHRVSRGLHQAGFEIPVISDGGIAYSGDAAKALAAGADCVMMGSVLAGTDESPGEKILHQGRTYISYRGMGSLDSMRIGMGSRERYSQGHITEPEQFVPQGIEGLVPYRGKVADVLHQFAGGVKFSLGYCGCRNLQELRENARFVRISGASLQEGHPHDIKIIKDAPNYQQRF